MSNYDMVLVGGPCINSLVAQLAADGDFPYTCETWPGRDFGRVQVIADAFATGKTALVIAGTTAAETDLAARVVQTGFNGATAAQKASAALEITGSVSSPAYSQ
jgi:S-layer protein (TIGR01564 family)